MSNNSQLRSELAKVRGLGSAKSGTKDFINQRLTAIAMIPLGLWFVCSLLCIATSGDTAKTAAFFASGFNSSMLILLLAAMFYHAKIGVQIIIEDYLHCPYSKMAALLFNLFLNSGLAVTSIVAVLKLHFSH